MAKKSQKGEARKVRELMEGFTEGTLVAADLIDAVNAGGVLSALAEELLGEMVGQHNCRVNHPSAGVRHPGPVVDQPELKDRLVDGPFSLGPAGSTGPEEANGSETSDDDLVEAEIADPDAMVQAISLWVHPGFIGGMGSGGGLFGRRGFPWAPLG